MISNTSWTELFRAKASIYALQEATKQWIDRGTSGAFVMFQNNSFQSDVRIKWEKHGRQFWWRLINGKLKPKGERAWVLKAWATDNNKQEILAIRFSNEQMSGLFFEKYNNVFPQQERYNNKVSSPKQYQSMPAQKEKWECAVCTYRNGGLRTTCEMCGLPKDASDNTQQVRVDQIAAPQIPDTPVVFNSMNQSMNQNPSIDPKQFSFQNHKSHPLMSMAQNQYSNQNPNQNPNYGADQYNASQNQMFYNNDYIMPQQNMQVNLNQQQVYIQNMPPVEPQQRAQPQPQQDYNNRGVQGLIQNFNNNIKQQQWRCDVCKMLNSNQYYNCLSCTSPREAANKWHGGAFNQWMNPERQPQPQSEPKDVYQLRNQWNRQKVEPKFDQNNMKQMAGMVIKEMDRLGQNKSSVSTEKEFQHAASYIASYNDDPYSIFKTLKSVAGKLVKDDMRYRTLDTTNPKVMERLIGFEGVLEFLMLLGFESDDIGMKLVCKDKPSQETIDNGANVLNAYVLRLGFGRITKKGFESSGGYHYTEDGKHEDTDTIDCVSDFQYPTLGGPDQTDDADKDDLTLEQIIVWATHDVVRDYGSMETLLLTHRTFTDSLSLLKQLRKRFFVPVPLNIRTDPEKALKFRNTVQKSIQLKVLKSIRDWMKRYWEEDFAGDPIVQQEVRLWLQEMSHHAVETNYMSHFAVTVNKEFERYLMSGPLNPKPPIVDLSLIPITGKKKLITSFTENDLADQITLMDFRLFSNIDHREFLGQAWKKKDAQETAPHLVAMINQFNDLTAFIQTQILREKNMKLRAKCIRRVLRMGQRFEELKNYYSLCAVYSALNSSSIHRLKHAWALIKKDQEVFDRFAAIFNRDRNHNSLRTIFSNTPPPGIPHIGLLLQDLVFIDEGNSKRIDIEINGRQNNIMNFGKCVRTADRIKSIKIYQNASYSHLKEIMDIQILLVHEFKKVTHITEDEMWDMSTEIKEADEAEANKSSWI